jgi:hypothetical protein
MNKRIQELAHEAGLPTYNPEGIPTKLEKFAELIVLECAEMFEGVYTDQHRQQRIDTRIKEHFGVEG